MTKIQDLNNCKHLNGVSIEKRIYSMMLKDAIDKDTICRTDKDKFEYLHTETKRGELDLLERDFEFDAKQVSKYKRKYKRNNK